MPTPTPNPFTEDKTSAKVDEQTTGTQSLEMPTDVVKDEAAPEAPEETPLQRTVRELDEKVNTLGSYAYSELTPNITALRQLAGNAK